MKSLIKIVMSSALLLGILSAGDEARIGTSGANQLLVPVGARGVAMSGADLVYSHGIESSYWNPAGLSRIEGGTVLASQMQMFGDVNVSFFGAGSKVGNSGAVGLTVKSIDLGDIPITTVEAMDGTGSTFRPNMSTISLTYANAFSDKARFGVSVKAISESIPRASASAFALDAGVQYENLNDIQGLGIALALKNIGTDMHYEGSGLTTTATDDANLSDFYNIEASYDKLPSTFDMAVSYKVSGATLALTYTSHNFRYDDLTVGGEYQLMDMIFLRGGMSLPQLEDDSSQKDDVLGGVNFGAGLKYSLFGTSLLVEYTYRTQKYFDGNSLISLSLGF
tara:strand:- start:1749 stop:2759 length:1011 start_codon:yes stop_codon:yes gene_type:complete